MTGKSEKGIVIRSTGSWYTVQKNDGTLEECRIKGKFRIQGIKSTNPIAVGDHVEIMTPEGGASVIKAILPRENYIIRKSTRLSKQTQIIAANIDQAMLVVTLSFPRTSTGFIDRFLVTAEAYHIPAIIVFNKTDLYKGDIETRHKDLVNLYESIGYQCISTSATEDRNIGDVAAALYGKVTLLAGHSGVGKSAIANAIDPALNLKTGVISDIHNKGKHTTTFAQMHALKSGGFIVDTPGIKEFGLVDMEKQEVAQRFPEMRALMHQCRFSNCTHVTEPGCAIKNALDEGKIHESRYRNYLNILDDDYWDEKNY